MYGGVIGKVLDIWFFDEENKITYEGVKWNLS